MLRAIAAKIRPQLHPNIRAYGTQTVPPLSRRVPLIPQPVDVVETPAEPKPPRLPYPQPAAPAPKPAEPVPAPEPMLPEEERIHNPSGVPVSPLSHSEHTYVGGM